jgi:hypothetical protein
MSKLNQLLLDFLHSCSVVAKEPLINTETRRHRGAQRKTN